MSVSDVVVFNEARSVSGESRTGRHRDIMKEVCKGRARVDEERVLAIISRGSDLSLY